MPVLIDGDNLLHAARAAYEANPLLGRSALCKLLAAWAQKRTESVHVVFDGPSPPPGLATQIGHPPVLVSFSGPGRTADSALIELVNMDSAARRLWVVSSDREIVRAAKRRRATPIGSDRFWALVTKDLARPEARPVEPEEKHTGLDAGDAQLWLREFGFGDERRTGEDGESES